MKKYFICFLSLILVFGNFLPVCAEEIITEDTVIMEPRDADSFYYYAQVGGNYNYAKAIEMLNLVNQLRAQYGVKPLKMDQEICDLAMQRAAEQFYGISHYRPDGTYGPDVLREGSYSYKTYGENISYVYSDATTVFNFWKSDPAHFDNMVSSRFSVMGVGVVYINGTWYWTQDFRDGECGESLTSKTSGSRTWSIRRIGSVDKVKFSATDINLDIDGSYTFRIRYDNDSILDNTKFVWTSSNPSVVTVENGTLTPVSLGTATVTAVYGNCKLSAKVKVIYGDGWHKINSLWYYYKNENPITGWVKDSGKWYYLDENGVMVRNLQTIDGKLYNFGTTGAMVTGWVELEDGWYYFNSEAKDGWQKIDDHWYYFKDLKMVKGLQVIDNKTYYLNNYMMTGWQKINDEWYYFNSDAKNGWQKINNKWYFFKDFVMQTGMIEDNGKTYYLNENGAMVSSGWVKVDEKWIYLETSTTKASGWKKIGNYWYYFDLDTNYMVSNRLKEINGVYYYFEANGHMHTGWLETCGIWRYYDANGKEASGWRKINNKWYYFIPENDNVMACSQTLTIDGKSYSFNAKGAWIQ